MAVERGERHGVAEPDPVELDRIEVAPRIVDLVREHDHRLPRQAQDRRELLVTRSDSRPRVDDEEDEVGLLDRGPCLARGVPTVGAGVGLVDPARID